MRQDSGRHIAMRALGTRSTHGHGLAEARRAEFKALNSHHTCLDFKIQKAVCFWIPLVLERQTQL